MENFLIIETRTGTTYINLNAVDVIRYDKLRNETVITFDSGLVKTYEGDIMKLRK